MKKNTYIISLGGSLIVPGKVATTYLKSFAALIRSQVARGDRFVIICGGGATSRQYTAAARALGVKQAFALDTIGIAATKLNAELVCQYFGASAYPTVVTDYLSLPKTARPIIIGAGWKPGWTTDFDAVIAAKHFGAPMVINCSDITHVYDRDPDRYTQARKLSTIGWTEYTKIIGPYRPGGNYPFDPIASRKARALRLKVLVCNGRNLANLKRIFRGKTFIGTTIQP